MRNKKIITLISIVAVVVVLVVVLVTVFSVAHVTVAFYDYEGKAIAIPDDTAAPNNQDILDKFGGKGIVLLSKQDIVEYVNNNYPQYHALDVVKEFPNSITVHVVRREEVYVIASGSTNIYIDSFGYVLQDRINDTRPLFDISDVFISNIVSSTAGNKLTFATQSDNDRLSMIIEAVNTIWMLQYNYEDIPALIDSIVFSVDNSTMTLTTPTNTKIVVEQPNTDMPARLIKAISVYGENKINLVGKTITVPLKGNITTN